MVYKGHKALFEADNFDVLLNKQQIENALKPYGLIRDHSQKYPTSHS
jgi:hypothetical protein